MSNASAVWSYGFNVLIPTRSLTETLATTQENGQIP